MGRLARRLATVLVLAAPPLEAQNLFVNPDLDDSLMAWVMGCGTQMSWIAEDADSCPGSGAMYVASGPCQGLQGAGAGQCVTAVSLGPAVSAAASVRASSGYLLVVLRFFASPDCSGSMASQRVENFGIGNGQWRPLAFENVTIPGGTGSILVGFGAVGSGTVDADIDAGYAGALPLVFREDFEGNLGGTPPACRWSVVAP